jgi:predicted phosphodiesterase
VGTTRVETTIILPDTQFPLHDRTLTKKLAEFIWDFQPDQIAHVGDLTDSTQLGRWVRGLPAQYDGGLEGGFQQTRDWLAYIRKGYDGPFHLSRANHDDRLEKQIERQMPELIGFTVGGRALTIENALDYDGFGVTYHKTYHELVPGWLLTHGDWGSLSGQPGMTALNQGRALGMSVVCGHTHRLGLVAGPLSSAHQTIEVMGMEVGHAMDFTQADYLKGLKNNWHQGFGVLKTVYQRGKAPQVYPQIVAVRPDYSWIIDGWLYK